MGTPILIRCPTCNRLFDRAKTAAMPFCSPRCRQIDLNRWLGEEFALPLPPPLDPDEAPPDDPHH